MIRIEMDDSCRLGNTNNADKGTHKKIYYTCFCSEIESKESFINDLEKILEENCFLNNDNFYLIIIGRYGSEYKKIIDYYKLWRTLKKEFEIDKFELGQEEAFTFNDKMNYIGMAKIPRADIQIALDIVFTYKNYSCLYFTNKNLNIDALKTNDIVCNIMNNLKKNIGISYDLVFSELNINERLVNFVYDGEEIALCVRYTE